jgi:hypothetical protein
MSTDTTVDNIATPETDLANWTGRQDELRVFNGTLTADQRATLVSTPTQGLANETDVAARVMFDTRRTAPMSVPAYYNGGSVDVSRAELNNTVASQPTDGDDFVRHFQTLSPTAGGTLDGAPVAFVTYTPMLALIQDVILALGLMALVPVVVVAFKILQIVREV